jgi:hypothetical protein
MVAGDGLRYSFDNDVKLKYGENIDEHHQVTALILHWNGTCYIFIWTSLGIPSIFQTPTILIIIMLCWFLTMEHVLQLTWTVFFPNS